MKNKKPSSIKSSSRAITILVVDDDVQIRQMFTKLLTEYEYSVMPAGSGQEAIDLIKENTPDIALLDYELPDISGIELISKLKEISPSILCLIITGFGTIERAVEAMQSGAWDFIAKPITSNMLLEKLERVKEFCELRNEHNVLSKSLTHDFKFSGVLGKSTAMQPVYENILRAAESHLPVLIDGETGVGKEYIADAIHLNSKRAGKPYVVMDCTATPESLIESTLFGSTKGAFTGSVERKGLLQAADGGSLLLDEVGEIAIDIQPKLLRCLETKSFRPVGSTKECTSDFRIICSTNRDLLSQTEKGEFRTDLFYRISAQRINIPSLRDRSSDIPMLAQHFINDISQDNNRSDMSFTPGALQALTQNEWPGNIRQLKFVIEASYFRARSNQITLEDLNIETKGTQASQDEITTITPKLDVDFKSFREEAILNAERSYLVALLEKHNGDVRLSAKQAGLTREALYRVMSRCDLSPAQFRSKTKK
jgi:DNA-binding NtrC family response regulator